MGFLELAKRRYSVRKYSTQPVEKEKLDLILEAGRVAPTGANRQPQRIIVVQTKEGLEKVGRAANIFSAPCALVVCCDVNEPWVRPFDGKKLTDIDASIVTDHMMLEATELGLGTLWVCKFKADVMKAEFALPESVEPINILAMGYSADETPQSPDRHATARKPLAQTVRFE